MKLIRSSQLEIRHSQHSVEMYTEPEMQTHLPCPKQLLRSDQMPSSVCTNSKRRSPNGFCISENSIQFDSIGRSGYPHVLTCQSISPSPSTHYSALHSSHKRDVNSQFIFATWRVMCTSRLREGNAPISLCIDVAKLLVETMK